MAGTGQKIAAMRAYVVDGQGGADYMEDYRSRSIVIGKEIRYIQNGVSYTAKAVGVDNSGGLEILTPDGEHKTLRSGEISIREL